MGHPEVIHMLGNGKVMGASPGSQVTGTTNQDLEDLEV
jgi:hypothetical protein